MQVSEMPIYKKPALKAEMSLSFGLGRRGWGAGLHCIEVISLTYTETQTG